MKKLKLLWTICALLCLGASNMWADKTIYLNPGVWNTGGARFALYMFVDNTTNAWTSFTEINGSGIYKATLSDTYPYMIIVRMKDTGDMNNFNNSWNQTADITSGITDNQIYTITGWGDDGKSPYSTSSPASLSDATGLSGKYLFKNVATGKYMGPANDWGTRASLIVASHYNTIDGTDLPDGYYKIESQVENGDNKHYLTIDGSALYLDQAGSTIRIKEVSTGVYAMSATEGVTFIGYDGTNSTLVWNLTDPSSNNAKWELISVDDATAISAALSGATLTSPKDATFLVKDANFDNKNRYSWDNFTLSKGGRNDHNYNVQMWLDNANTKFNIHQTLTNLPNGIYKLTCQGFYRPGGNTASDATTRNVVLYAGSQTSRLMNINQLARTVSGSGYSNNESGKYVPNNQTDAYDVFSAGDYSNNSLYAIVTNGSLTIGIKKEEADYVAYDWTCFDNVRLYYYGPQTTVPADMTFMIENPSFETGNMTGWTAISENNVIASGGEINAKPVASYALSNSDGSYIMNYYGWSWSCDPINGISQTIPDMPAGKYRLEAVLGGWAPTTAEGKEEPAPWEMVLKVNGEEEVKEMTTENEGVSFSVDIELKSTADLKITAQTYHKNQNTWEPCFFKADNFRLYSLDNYYEELNAAIIAAEANTLGFDDGEYAPYNNVEAITALNVAKAIYDDQSTYHSWEDLQTALSDLTGAEWTANVGEVNAIYNPTFALSTNNMTALGWGSNDGTVIGNESGEYHSRALKGDDYLAALNETKSALYLRYDDTNSNISTIYNYGTVTGYTMPLKANTVYRVKADAGVWSTDATQKNKDLRVAILNSSSTEVGGQTLTTPNSSIGGGSTDKISYDFLFKTGESGNYTLTVDNMATTSTGIVISNFELKRATSVTATLGTNGYTTFASPYPLDLTTANLPEGVTAYKATSVDGIHIRFTALNQTVPENTGILLEGEASDDVTINLVPSGTTVTENILEVNEDGTTFDAESGYTYYGLIKGSSHPLKFGYFDPSSVAIPADKAYLKVYTGGEARSLIIVFGDDDDETTGVADMKIAKEVEGNIYNLSGQRVTKPAKGLYIKNNKKMIVK